MRCSRSPGLYSAREREKWQRMAKILMKEVSSGTLSYDDFTDAMKLPGEEQHTKSRWVSDICVRYSSAFMCSIIVICKENRRIMEELC
jgi:hypothetical protein